MEEKKKALITGITGQDGSYLAELLLQKGYEVHGLVRRSSSFNRWRIDHLREHEDSEKIFLHYGDLSHGSSLARLIEKIAPDEIYNLAAQSHVKISFDIPEHTMDITSLGPLRLLEAIRDARLKTKFYQASSSEMFGKAQEFPQTEKTPFYPRSPYGVSKVAAYWITKNYRESYGIHISNGILFNHESPRRGENFVTRKITIGLAEILAGKRDKIYLGNLNAKRDWGYAPEYVEAMWRMLQRDKGDDYVVATGETHTIEDFVKTAFQLAGINDWEKYIGIDPKYYRPAEVDYLIGDYTKAKQELGWEPKTAFKDLIKIMLEADCKSLGVSTANLPMSLKINNMEAIQEA
ncbi:MAG: GDP-mannose 4,6-dehydratase [Candidatus Harrisonbacteria bacterium CG10_big_fil_rev_8_21_14_0_10_40_38]|uniref:GDP-mannose 4,6-dehydratase n=1 Tax=Candidatus Harrisonbacteria bacterium CG10_big_fil_rev_8_21_14_0_10_40_38 TaxID=1974583 RepID=A0A2H0URN9_9BACT|nr:MAG: GDP-mannose 4,6-dehydratase [Candidatus Harrisonbacteria bacterium CG10_big_fil_rev_8_21_14_0_10_40_38]